MITLLYRFALMDIMYPTNKDPTLRKTPMPLQAAVIQALQSEDYDRFLNDVIALHRVG